MYKLKKQEQSQILDGGYWWRAPDGKWFYIDGDEEPDGNDIIWG